MLKATDYYSYAQQNNLQLDYLRTIDAETWQQLKTSNDASALALFSGGLFSLSDDYSTFDEKRTKYLETVHYSRNESQAINILQITTSPRAFPAYEQCLEHLSQVGLVVFASKEDVNQIELHVKYQNPSGVSSIVLTGLVSGGSVPGAPVGHLWKDGTRWGIKSGKGFHCKPAYRYFSNDSHRCSCRWLDTVYPHLHASRRDFELGLRWDDGCAKAKRSSCIGTLSQQ